MKRLFNCILLSPLLLLLACNRESNAESNPSAGIPAQDSSMIISAGDFVSYVNEKAPEFAVSKTIGDFIYTVRYIPTEYMALKEIGDTASGKKLKELVKDLEVLQYFNLSIQHRTYKDELVKYQISSAEDYNQRIGYLSFEMQNDIRLMDGNNELNCELFHFERSYNIAPFLNFTMAFKNTNSLNDRTFSFNDILFKNGRINITFDKSLFNNLPKIKTI